MVTAFITSRSLQAYVYTQSLSHVRLFVTLWTVALQAPLSMRFPTQEYWSGLPFPTQGVFLTQGLYLQSLASPALAGRFFTTSEKWEALQLLVQILKTYIHMLSY